MYKTRNTETGNGMRGTRGIGGMSYFGECRQTFWGMSPNIADNVAKYSGEYRKKFRGMSSNVRGTSSKIPRNAHNGLVFKFSGRAPKHGTQFY